VVRNLNYFVCASALRFLASSMVFCSNSRGISE
jgi:hypothetical protein